MCIIYVSLAILLLSFATITQQAEVTAQLPTPENDYCGSGLTLSPAVAVIVIAQESLAPMS
jgi:hypothetical protein